jgi:hypothetical protein
MEMAGLMKPKSLDQLESSTINIKGDNFTFDEMYNVIMTSARIQDFHFLPFIRIVVYHMLYYLFWVPGLIMITLLELIQGRGYKTVIHNIRFVGALYPVHILQFILGS